MRNFLYTILAVLLGAAFEDNPADLATITEAIDRKAK